MTRRRPRLNDSWRRGLRTGIDVLLSGLSSGLILLILQAFKVEVTVTQFATLTSALTPVLSVIKNALEDKSGKSLLVSKQRPTPDPTAADPAPPVAVLPEVNEQADPVTGEVPGACPNCGMVEMHSDFCSIGQPAAEPVAKARPAKKAPAKKAPAKAPVKKPASKRVAKKPE